MKKVKMLENVILPGSHQVQKDDVCEMEDEAADRYVASKLAELAEGPEEEGEHPHAKRKKK